MKTANVIIRRIIVASAISLTLAAPVMAQQEVSPDRFESSPQSVQPVQKASKASVRKSTNKQNAKLQNAHKAQQTASLKNTSELTQMARK
jgi:mannitol-specific phosphotransferase system IIBC component